MPSPTTDPTGLEQARTKMTEAGVAPAAVETFTRFYHLLQAGETGLIREDDVDPLVDIPNRADLRISDADAADALGRTAMLKLNGGLGTSMGMDQAKSLLPVREAPDGTEVLTFLDIIVGQVRAARQATGARLPLLFMNSFRTRDDSLAALERYPDIAVDGLPVDFLQNREPKLLADDLTPVTWEQDPDLEWCPPGHGDLYPALHSSGVVVALLEAGFRYMCVSNSDNLGATPDATIAGWFAASGAPYAAELCRKTPADVKGGQLVVRKADGRIVQRETAQTHPDDVAASLDATRHPFFHTNNLWFDLEALAAELERTGGVLELPLIRNDKTVDPADPASPAVVQIESAMGAAVAVFEGATAIEVERSRFLPVKTTNDLLVLRSDVYDLTADYRLEAQAPAPLVDLDKDHYKLIDGFTRRFAAGAPSLRDADSLTVRGDWTFGSGVRAEGKATLSGEGGTVPDGATIGAEGF
ncbi:UTP--glucose-1-phosphate uridylyltransferase [Promicromonospora thailandica]|uniref:UTP--glucose-1-phosphate uridylyltransferase n=1 Tax=Promicromonospora thailandica TaxID=765201 RepID=A0A9X2G449_9MICO|nr:UTP--glucose-1-phosphate uridylyltransferase [Promicromonospora thailandica]MCP2265328.1 UTP--glucose-1-phosphate uridylyltransferase [Promicromonospora thailandica]BFF16860.1 UTP--glucose-1-phosphate uridylyltransferase [Promicromonospora thailandica]